MIDDALSYDQRRSRARQEVLAELRKFSPADIRSTPNSNSLLLHMLVLDAVKSGETSYKDAWLEVFQFINQGVLLPIANETYNMPSNIPMRGAGSLYFVISEYGKRFIRQTSDQLDPYLASSILKPLENLNIFNETVRVYIPEACRALEARANIGAVILVGVAAESVTEHMYVTFLGHLNGAEKKTLRYYLTKSVQQKLAGSRLQTGFDDSILNVLAKF